jgi:hypothetical protein
MEAQQQRKAVSQTAKDEREVFVSYNISLQKLTELAD